MNNNFKNDKFVEVVQEFQIVQGQSVYQIGSIDLKDVYFFVKNGNENYKVLATGQYTVDGVNLTINDPNIILTNTHIQVCRVYSTVASKYISDVVNINTLREHYNVLVDDFINVIDFLRKSGIKSDSSAMNYVFPLLEEGQVFMRKGLGFEGRQIMDINGELQLQINKAVEIFEKYLNEQKKPEIDNYIGEKETELENRLEIFTQEKIQQINDVGLKLEINQTNHGFLFDAVQYDVSRGIYIKASATYGADGMAIRINSNKFYLVSNGLVKVPDLAVDSGGRAYVMDEFYFLDNYIAGGCTPEKPTNIFQPLFCIVDKDGIKSALIQVDTPIDLEPREITELGLPNKENTIEDLIKSRKYKVGDIVQVLGYYSAGDGAGHPRIKKPEGYNGTDAVIGADGSIWGIVHSGEVNVSWFGAKGDGVTDDTISIKKCILFSKDNKTKIKFGAGEFCFSETLEIGYEGFCVEGVSDSKTILKSISNISGHICVSYNSFRFGTTSDQYLFRCVLKNIGVKGNTNTGVCFFTQGMAMANWENVIAYFCNTESGVAFKHLSVQLSSFKNVSCSGNLLKSHPVAFKGLLIEEGSRGGSIAGNSTNNTFTNCYYESTKIGGELKRADNNFFIGGAFEGCDDKGLLIDSNCKWNTFQNLGFEKNKSGVDLIDDSRLSRFINSYFDNEVRITGQLSVYDGCSFGSVVLSSTSVKNSVINSRVNFHGQEQGGVVDVGDNNRIDKVQDMYSGVFFKRMLPPRVSKIPTASPYVYENNSNVYQKVVIQSGVVESVRCGRGEDLWLESNLLPNSYLLAPGDRVRVVYSAVPAISVVNMSVEN
ncbi:MAG: glycosyl hydrolase family 28-related protein [Clostridium sp.]